ncbi:MAG: toll/interleukin-1 receptor domain-containing protein [Coleofasciculaceae cyanobacterium]
MKAFISHSSIDKPFVERLATDLRTREGIDAWLDKWEIMPGDRIPEKLEEGLANAGTLVLVLSPDSVNSQWVSYEKDAWLTAQVDEEKQAKLESRSPVRRLIPVLYKDCEKPFFLKSFLHVGINDENYEAGFQQLVRGMRGESGKPPLKGETTVAPVPVSTIRLEKTLAEPAIAIVSENYSGYEITAQVQKIISEYTQQPFEGREEEKRRLDEFIDKNYSGVLLVTAAAGFGKSALLSHWQETRQDDYFIVYHCFSYRYEKTRLVSEAYRHLLKQLYLYHNIRNGQFPNDENGLRDILVGMLNKPVSLEGKRLVIVLDGLDEAAKTFEPFFTGLPAGVFVIASARAESGDEPEYLRNWTDNAERLCLKRLPREAISKWLGQIRELAAYAEDNEFVESLDETTDGFPLYLRFLIDDLRQAATKNQDVQAVVRNSPGGFKAYVKEQFRLLAKVEEIKQKREVQELFALLSVALGALAEDDIEDLTNLSAWDLETLPWQATRWFSIQMGVYSFAHPLLADEFQGVLGRQAKLAEGKLIDYCARWQENHSAYGLRYYAEHLRDMKRWEELYAIARDEDFASAQQQQLPEEPDLSLKTVQTALLGAAEEDKAEIMAEFLLLHAHRLVQTNTQESPLEALRSGTLQRALRLADQYDIERCVLWYLLLAWELKDEDKLEEARGTLEKLQEKELPRFPIHWSTQWQREYARYLLAHIFEVSEKTCIALHQKLFEDADHALLFYFLVECGDLKAALEITRKTFPSFWWVLWMGQIAKAQMEVGQREEAEATFAEAIETTHQIENLKTRINLEIKTLANQYAMHTSCITPSNSPLARGRSGLLIKEVPRLSREYQRLIKEYPRLSRE